MRITQIHSFQFLARFGIRENLFSLIARALSQSCSGPSAVSRSASRLCIHSVSPRDGMSNARVEFLFGWLRFRVDSSKRKMEEKLTRRSRRLERLFFTPLWFVVSLLFFPPLFFTFHSLTVRPRLVRSVCLLDVFMLRTSLQLHFSIRPFPV